MNSKAFLFTISVIIFASTLITMTQLFSNYSLNYERTVLTSYKTTLQPYLNDDLSFDLMRLLNLDLDINYSLSDINFTLNSSMSKNFNFAQKLLDYNSFLNNKYFPNTPGTQSINFNTNDNILELLFGSDYEYKYNFDSNIIEFISYGDSLNTIDVNIDLTSTDLNQIIVPSSPSGSASINISYTDDQNYFSASYDFDPESNYEVIFVYNNDYNMSVQFGDTRNNNSFKIDSNVPAQLNFALKLNYDFDSTKLPVRFNTILSQTTECIDSNSELKVSN